MRFAQLPCGSRAKARGTAIRDPNGYEIWFYTNVAEPKPPTGAKLV